MRHECKKNKKNKLLRLYFSMTKVPTSLSLFLLDTFYFVSFQNFDGFLFVKQLSKAFTKFYCENGCTMSERCILKNGGPSQVLKNVKD